MRSSTPKRTRLKKLYIFSSEPVKKDKTFQSYYLEKFNSDALAIDYLIKHARWQGFHSYPPRYLYPPRYIYEAELTQSDYPWQQLYKAVYPPIYVKTGRAK